MLKQECDYCGKKVNKNSQGYRANRPWYHCSDCKRTTILDPDKEFIEFTCRVCGKSYNAVFAATCENCKAGILDQVRGRYIPVSEIETMMK